MVEHEEPGPFRDLEEMLDAIIDYGIVKLDVHGKVASWSRGAQALTGYTADEVIGQPVSIFYTDTDKAAGLVERALEAALASGHFEFEGWRVRKGGETFWCRGVNACIHDQGGTLSGFVTVFRDSSERRRAELTSARLAAIVRSSDAAIFAMTPDKVVATWNTAAGDLLGYTEAEIVGSSVEVLIPDEARGEFDTSIRRLQAGEHATRHDSWRRRKDGSLVEVDVSLSAVRDSTGELSGYSVVLQDLTDRRRAEEELAVARSRDEIFHERERIAHDLHDLIIQRLFAAGMAIEGAVNRVANPELASELRNVVEDLDATIIEIRSTIFALGHSPEPTPSLRSQLLAVVSDAVKALGFEPQIRFVGPVDTIVPGEVADHLLATVREALSNVVHHAHASSVEVRLQAGEEIMLEVTDNGCGIGTVSRKGGLANLADRAETLGGTLMVTKKDDAGTRLMWSVPGHPPSRQPDRTSEHHRVLGRKLHRELPTQ